MAYEELRWPNDMTAAFPCQLSIYNLLRTHTGFTPVPGCVLDFIWSDVTCTLVNWVGKVDENIDPCQKLLRVENNKISPPSMNTQSITASDGPLAPDAVIEMQVNVSQECIEEFTSPGDVFCS